MLTLPTSGLLATQVPADAPTEEERYCDGKAGDSFAHWVVRSSAVLAQATPAADARTTPYRFWPTLENRLVI